MRHQIATDITTAEARPHRHRTEPQAQARGRTAPTGTALTRNETLVLETLESADAPLKAYELLGQLKTQGVKAPMTVYRALERLEGRGLVHKLDGLGAFVVCNHDEPHALQTFLVCDGCAGVTEVRGAPVEAGLDAGRIESLAHESGFSVGSARLEIRGRCETCA